MILYLTGYRCTGKTTLGRLVAAKLGYGFVDADVALTDTYGMSVAQIVEAGGWDDFRDKETRILEKLSTLDNHVIATGGGVILRTTNVEMMKRTGTVLWLIASVETIAARMVSDNKTGDQRPGLTDKGVIDEISDVMEIRAPLYNASADIRIDTDAMTIDQLTDKIYRVMQAQ